MNSGNDTKKLILALPKGRILEEAMPILKFAGIEPEPAFFESSDRRLRFSSNHNNIREQYLRAELNKSFLSNLIQSF